MLTSYKILISDPKAFSFYLFICRRLFSNNYTYITYVPTCIFYVKLLMKLMKKMKFFWYEVTLLIVYVLVAFALEQNVCISFWRHPSPSEGCRTACTQNVDNFRHFTIFRSRWGGVEFRVDIVYFSN
jgi:hypothetical protein